MKLPDFIIIGAAKCGTSALFMNLDKHPDIFMGQKTKTSIEFHFWGYPKNYKKGLNWYKKAFKKDKVCGEKSIEYWVNHKSMKLIKRYIPNVRLILCVRNPVDRAFSNYQLHHRKGRVGAFTYKLFKQQSVYYKRGLYYKGLVTRVLKYFDKDQIYICVTEHMKQNTTEEIRKIYKFLGVKDFVLPTKKISGNVKERASSFGEDFIKSREEKFYRVWDKGTMKMEPALRNQLLQYYRQSNEELFDFLGYRIKEWMR